MNIQFTAITLYANQLQVEAWSFEGELQRQKKILVRT